MLRKIYFVREDQHDFLKSLPGSAAEHVRRAIDDYKVKKLNANASISRSKDERR